jgi:hypothetical protein
MVKMRPSGETFRTSPYPTVLNVITVMYRASSNGQPSITMYPRVPPESISRAMRMPTAKKGVRPTMYVLRGPENIEITYEVQYFFGE